MSISEPLKLLIKIAIKDISMVFCDKFSHNFSQLLLGTLKLKFDQLQWRDIYYILPA